MKEYTIRIKNAENCNHYEDFNIEEVIKVFAEHGFNVTEEAVMHNYEAWKGDFKVGLRMWKTAISFLLPAVAIPCVSWLAN